MASFKGDQVQFFLCFTLITIGTGKDFCLTPKFEIARCVSLFACPDLMKALGSLEPVAISFVRKSLCHGRNSGDVLVCCGKNGYYNDITTATPPTSTTINVPTKVLDRREYVKKKLLPNRKFCGYQHTDDRFYVENVTALDEFPWLVHVIFIEDEEDDPEQFADRCNGVLINNRYVLTSEYCATYSPKVRLGQYITDRNVTCIENPLFPECNEPVYDVNVEEEIHRLGNTSTTLYDFSLLRLNHKVIYTDFVRPICLPLEESTRPAKDELLTFSGWGASGGDEGATKKRLIYKQSNKEECYKADEKDLQAATENVTLMCLKPHEANTEKSCAGDEGGPLMYSSRRKQWFVEGLVIRVYEDNDTYCSDNQPISGVKITQDVIDWILDTIRP